MLKVTVLPKLYFCILATILFIGISPSAKAQRISVQSLQEACNRYQSLFNGPTGNRSVEVNFRNFQGRDQKMTIIVAAQEAKNCITNLNQVAFGVSRIDRVDLFFYYHFTVLNSNTLEFNHILTDCFEKYPDLYLNFLRQNNFAITPELEIIIRQNIKDEICPKAIEAIKFHIIDALR